VIDGFAPVRPAYGSGSLADLLPSVAAGLGVPGFDDVLGLPLSGVERIGVLLVDGMGAYQIPEMVPHAPILAGLGDRTLTSGFPSTTPVSLVTLGAGVPPGAHGVLGFTVRKPDGERLAHIYWGDDPPPAVWQPVPTVFERAAAAGVATTLVTRPEYRGSGLTVSANRGASFVAAADASALADGMLAALRGSGPALVYGYHPELDQRGHETGVLSSPWIDAARGVGELISRLVEGLPSNAALLVTADHGQFNVPAEARFDLGVDPVLGAGLECVTGEPRVRYLYPVPGAHDDVIAAYRAVLGESAWVLRRDEAIAEGWFGAVPEAHRGRIGEIVVICLDRAVVLASKWEPPAVASLVAFHGSVTAAEMTVPLLIARD
jgi:hypothetical protein